MTADPATQAFEELRREVSLLRRAVEGLSARGDDQPVDYSPTLAKLAEAIAAIAARVQTIADSELMIQDKQGFSELLGRTAAHAVRQPLQEAERTKAELKVATEKLERVTDQLVQATGAPKARRDQWRDLAWAGVLGCCTGTFLWALGAGPVARVLPAGWQVPERMAAATLAETRAGAGAHLLRSADPIAWRRLEAGQAFLLQNQAVLERCSKRSERLRRQVNCEVRLGR